MRESTEVSIGLEDAKVLLPELADQVAAAEQERHAAVLAVSTH